MLQLQFEGRVNLNKLTIGIIRVNVVKSYEYETIVRTFEKW